jgi:hypothetical protein
MKFINISSIALAVFTVLLTIVFFTWWAFKDKVVFGAEKFDQTKWIQHAATVEQECKRSCGLQFWYLKKKIESPLASLGAIYESTERNAPGRF